MTATTDFAGVDFCTALGEVYGLRAWKVDGYGRLGALHVTGAPRWRPGVNAASCHKGDGGWYAKGGLISFPSSFVNAVYGDLSKSLTVPPALEQAPPPEKHDAPLESCTCGFYAYTDPRHEEAAGYRGASYVTGVVRGSGRTLIGTKGFRCEKAEIVALLDPTRGGRKAAEWRVDQAAKLTHVYPDVPLMPSRSALLEFAPIESTMPDPSADEFWTLP